MRRFGIWKYMEQVYGNGGKCVSMLRMKLEIKMKFFYYKDGGVL